jgi:hypothetical protein
VDPKKESSKYLAWKSWDQLYQTKRNGGLGFKHTKDFNKVLISKFTWKIAAVKESLCLNALRSKYKVRKGWLRKEPVKYASPI